MSNPDPTIFEDIEKTAQTQSKFLKIQAGQTIVLKFDTSKIQLVDRQIGDRKSKAV